VKLGIGTYIYLYKGIMRTDLFGRAWHLRGAGIIRLAGTAPRCTGPLTKSALLIRPPYRRHHFGGCRIGATHVGP